MRLETPLQIAQTLRAFIDDQTLLAFDFDGTLAPIVPRPMDAAMRPSTRQKLTRLCSLRKCVVLTGRSRVDAIERLAGVAVAQVVGDHGASLHGAGNSSAEVSNIPKHQAALASVRAQLHDLSGLEFEDKETSFAVHFRRAQQPEQAEKRILSVLESERSGMRVIPGIFVVNVIPANMAHKGDALVAMMGQFHKAKAFYIGDDTTDEDVFASADPAQVLTIRVGYDEDSAAQHFLSHQDDIDVLLDLLLELSSSKEPPCPQNATRLKNP